MTVMGVTTAGWMVAAMLIGGCNFANKPSSSHEIAPPSPSAAQVSMTTPFKTIINASGESVLHVTVRLHNPAEQSVQLFAGTPCAVFRWRVTSVDDEIIQRKPNQLCAQVVATDVLLANQSLERQYKIILDNTHYRSGTQYLLRYQFWRHNGIHSFTLTD